MAEAAGAPALPLLVLPVTGLPEVRAGDDLAALVAAATSRRTGASGASASGGPGPLRPGDVVVVSSKVVSKAAGLRWPGAGEAARSEAVRAQSSRVVAERDAGGRVVQVVESVAGPVMAAAGVDASNTGEDPRPLLLPDEPDAVAADLRDALAAAAGLEPGALGVVLSDTAGRPWRAGQTDFALGSAGVAVLEDLRGGVDADGRPLAATARAVADELAAAADLVKGKAASVPVAVLRGTGLVDAAAPGAATLVRTGSGDWFSLGAAEAVRAALGVAPGSAAAAEVGLPAAGAEPVADRVARAVRVALRDAPASVGLDAGDADVRVAGDDRYEVGRVVARLEVALRGEGVAARVLDTAATTVELRLTDLGA